MKFEIIPAYDISLADQAAIFNRVFSDYLVRFTEMDAAAQALFLRAQGADLCYSRFIRGNGELAGFGYINCTSNISRLAAMGVAPQARRNGMASVLLSHLIDEARSRGDEAMVLEVFEQNIQALELYRRHKFREMMRLFGWRRKPLKIDAPRTIKLERISLNVATQLPVISDFPDIPWPVSRHAVTRYPGARAYRADNVCLIIGDPEVSPTRIFTLLGYDPAKLSAARDLVARVLHDFPDNEFFVREVSPEILAASVFEPLGFTREPLNQFLMRLDF